MNKSYLDLAIVKISKIPPHSTNLRADDTMQGMGVRKAEAVYHYLFYFVREFHSFGSIVLKFRDSSILLFAFGT